MLGYVVRERVGCESIATDGREFRVGAGGRDLVTVTVTVTFRLNSIHPEIVRTILESLAL